MAGGFEGLGSSTTYQSLKSPNARAPQGNGSSTIQRILKAATGVGQTKSSLGFASPSP